MPAAWIIGPTTFRANERIVHIEPNYMDEDALDGLYGCASHHGYSQYYLPSMR